MPPSPRVVETIIVMTPFVPMNLTQVKPETLEGITFPLTICRDLIAGLDYLHQKEILHRDIKPANICIIVDPPRAIIADYGNALQGCAVRGCSSKDHNVGTIPYLAPEIMALKRLESDQPFGKSADVWSLGMTLAEYILRAPLTTVWDAHGISKEHHGHLNSHLSAPRKQRHKRKVPEDLHAMLTVVARMLAWNADERPCCAAMLPSAEAALIEQTSVQKPIAILQEIHPKKRRR